MKIIRGLFYLLMISVLLLFGVIGFFRWSVYYPKPIEDASVYQRGTSPPKILNPGQSVRVMNWNVAAFVGNKDNNFFEPGVKHEYPSESRYRQIIKGVSQIIRDYDPDVINLQDVDVDSKRSAYLDQAQILMDQLPDTYQYHVCVTQGKAKWLPSKEMKYGGGNFQICTISKYKLTHAKRYTLHGLDDLFPFSWILPYCRVASVSEIPVMGQHALVVENTYWSAWDYSVSEKMKQSFDTLKVFRSYYQQGHPVVLSGDFNSLAHKELINDVIKEDRPSYQPYQISPLKVYFDLYAAAPSYQQAIGASRKKYFTYMPSQLKQKVADRTLDFIFISPELKFEGSSVLQTAQTKKLSDHYPEIATIRLPHS